ncbi:TRAP transporter small permease [Entomohabitans teleogrylli]|uniref:TRAP transporter small permease n=1 Tax=Entomohabitans teleogrylli TaxID=1384589 RepID=UPI00073D9923|nr:TRAP transporter small permease [Entomohabitans teleogrylli]
MSRFYQLELAAARIGLVAIVCVILLGGIGRALGHPIIWSLEIAMVLFAWVSMLAIDFAMQSRRHIGIEALRHRFPAAVQRLLVWLNEFLILAFLGCGVWFGYSFTWLTHSQQLPVTQLSIAWLNSAVPTGCLLMFLTTLIYIARGCPDPQKENAL